MRRALGSGAIGAALLASMLVPATFSIPPAAGAEVASLPNPLIKQSCGLELNLVLDASGSVSSSHAVEDVRDAGDALLSALVNTNSTARVTQFASLSQVLAERTQIDDTSMASSGTLAKALQAYYNPIPPRPSDVDIYRYNAGDPTLPASFSKSNDSNQYTNWDQGLAQAGTSGSELMVYVTDGDPTAYDLDRPSDPFDQGPPPDVAMNTNRGDANALTMDRAVEEANAIKTGRTRVLAVGVGEALSSDDSVDRLIRIAGPKVARDADLAAIDSLNKIDVALVTDFKKLAQFMRSLVLQLCSPSLTVRKLAQTATNPNYLPEQGRQISVTPTVPGGSGFTWILPDTTAAATKTQPTDVNGFAQFQWEPIPPERNSTATVTEATSATTTPGRPGVNNDYRCELRDEAGKVRVVEADFADLANPSFVLDPIKQEIVTCTIYNSFKYQPQILLDKVNSPTEVRGDLIPKATVTSRYTVTNPGNTPLSAVTVTDNRCGLVIPVLTGSRNVGDLDGDGLLDPGTPAEAWQFTCSRLIRETLSTTPGGHNIVNVATVTGLDPANTRVTDDDSDDVDVFTPAITLVKTVNGGPTAVINAGQSANYQYIVTNAGNTPLGSVDLSDDTPPCTEPTLVTNGNGDAVLDLGESWTYSCTATPVTDVVNTADVSAVPLNPMAGNTPFAAPNPPVTAFDVALVTVVNTGLDLAKSVDPPVVLLAPGASPPGETVTYTFTAENSGNTPLARPGGASTDPGWVQDPQCLQPAVFVGGDVAPVNTLLDPGETWTFTCTGSITAPTVNEATLVGQPTNATGAPLPVPTVSDVARAFVDVQQPEIVVTKTAIRPVVLDPDANAVAGPDTPNPRQAQYRYEVANPGDVPLSLAGTPVADDKCAPLTFVEGDTANVGLLDPGEVWVYTCATTLQREDAATPPGNKPAVVGNTVRAVGVPFFAQALVPAKAVSAEAKASVIVIQPALELTKTASAEFVRSGHPVDYTVTVRNTGDSALQLGGPVDDRCAPLVYQSGDTDGDLLLDGANTAPEIWMFTCTAVVVAHDVTNVVTNTASVTGVDALGNSYQDSDSASVRVVDPAIEVTKTPSDELVPAGTDVTYTFTVRNVGRSAIAAQDALASVKLRDVAKPGLPSCRKPKLVAKTGGNQDDFLDRDPAEAWRYECVAPIDEVTTDVAIVAGIGGGPVGLHFPVADWDAVRVKPFHPGIEVEKTASPKQLSGPGQVTYTYRVNNTGDVPLANVADRIEDDTCSPVKYESGDVDGDGLLDSPDSIFEDELDETWVFTCTTEVNKDTTNVVTVSGSPSDQDGNPLCGTGTGTGSSRVKKPCDAAGQDTANVQVESGVSPASGGGGEPGDGLGNTGAAAWLREGLLLGLLLVAGGALLIAWGRRRDPSGA